MPGISHERFLALGWTVMPVRIERLKEIVGVPVDESYGMYTVWNTSNSADLCFGRIDDRGYIDVRGNPRWVHQFHPKEWPLIEERLSASLFVDTFSSATSVGMIISSNTWDRHYERRYNDSTDNDVT